MQGEKKSENTKEGHLSAGKHLTCWFEPGVFTNLYPELNSDEATDVVIVGGGIAGLTTAYCLSKSGKKVIVVEDGFIGSGETGRTTAQFVTALDDRYYNMEEIFGKDQTKLIAESHAAAIDLVERIVKEENIDCGFRILEGYLFLHNSDDPGNLVKEYDALKRCGFEVDMLGETPGLTNSIRSIRYPRQAQLQPLKYLTGLCKAIEKNGGKVYINTHASEFTSSGITSDKGHTIKAEHIVVATNAPVNDKYAMMLKQWAHRSYVITALIKKGTLPYALWWDTGDQTKKETTPYHYVRLSEYNDEYDLLVSGGEDHIVGIPEDVPEENRYALLEKWTREHFPVTEIISRWSGEVLVPMDSIAFLGRNPFDSSNVYIITGDSGIGMTYCTIGAMLITDLINGRENKWEDIYKPSRFKFNSSGPFFRMLKGDTVAVLKKWFYMNDEELSNVKEGQGRIVKLDGKKCGAYRDENGKLFLVSAECTHLKCMVSWNNDEKSWDCPCHGSRFTYTGKVINGPANEDLPAFTEN
ncbi:MAG TPA: FAD-dependent oxidoreductase [Bacteroidia bacterium]|jgi:glycine/D-amino acid oxidase-like deaminating enzyme/nitrite reductase/ring-hydroxylating ferredoxin subunit